MKSGTPLTDTTRTLVQAFVSCHLDYCNSLLYSRASDSLIQKVQSVQYVTTCLITRAWRCDHIIPVLHQLHWFLFDDESNTRSHVLFTSHCRAWQWHLCTWRMTSTSSPTVVIVCSDQLLSGHVSSHHPMNRQQFWQQALLLQARVYETHCHPFCVRTSAMNSLSDFSENISIWELADHGTSWLYCLLCLRNILTDHWPTTQHNINSKSIELMSDINIVQ